uniref:Uncharacterized protein n=1 Tax=Anguilla anguilla TaxID=7936 RepID=A0A0E9UE83_ANGAN
MTYFYPFTLFFQSGLPNFSMSVL